MDRILFGDNQFFGINHMSEERARAQAMRFADDAAIMKVLDDAYESGAETFMCTVHDRIANLCDIVRANPEKYRRFKWCPSIPYAHKYADAMAEKGVMGALKEFSGGGAGGMISTVFKGGVAAARKDVATMMKMLVDAELKPFKGLQVEAVFLLNVTTDLMLGLGMTDLFAEFAGHVRSRYNTDAGFMTMNAPALVDALESVGVMNPLICTPVNKIGFRMNPSREAFEELLDSGRCRVVAMSVLASGALRPPEALEYVCNLKGVESLVFGASSRAHIEDTVSLINSYWGDAE